MASLAALPTLQGEGKKDIDECTSMTAKQPPLLITALFRDRTLHARLADNGVSPGSSFGTIGSHTPPGSDKCNKKQTQLIHLDWQASALFILPGILQQRIGAKHWKKTSNLLKLADIRAREGEKLL